MKIRVQRIPISPDILMRIVRDGSAWRIHKGIPEDAKLRGFTLDPYSSVLNLFVEHESFDLVEIDRQVTPILDVLFETID